MDIDIFRQDLPNRKLYGYGDLCVGDVCEVDLIKHNKDPNELQRLIHSYGQYAKKKFRTKNLNNTLYIKRIK